EDRYLYCAAERERRQQQWAARQAQQSAEDDRVAARVLFYSLLDEQQRRLFAGLASLEWGHGGDQRMAQLFGLDVDTVARGRAELHSGQVLRERVRRVGAGRPRAEKKRPKSGANSASCCARTPPGTRWDGGDFGRGCAWSRSAKSCRAWAFRSAPI